jgi:hypothetical protein
MTTVSPHRRSALLARTGFVLSLVLLGVSLPTHAEEPGGPTGRSEHTLIVGVGPAAEWEPGEGAVLPGGNLMLEWDAIEDWFEFEVGASLLASRSGLEVPVDLLIKKPFTLTSWAEVMVGGGPEVVRVVNRTAVHTYFGAELAVDFMFWPTHRIGWWIEPTYDLTFSSPLSQGVGVTGGLLVGW